MQVHCRRQRRTTRRSPQFPRGNCDMFLYMVRTVTSSSSKSVSFDQKSASGWLIFVSGLVIIYQTLALLQLFLNFKLLHMKIPVYKSLWTLFYIIVSGFSCCIFTVYMHVHMKCNCCIAVLFVIVLVRFLQSQLC